MIPIFPCDSQRSKGVLSGTGDFPRLLLGELGTPRLAPIFAYGKWLYPYRIQLYGASDLDQRCLKTLNSKNGCTFPPNILAPTPKITPNPHFGGPFNAKPIQIDLRKSHDAKILRKSWTVWVACKLQRHRWQTDDRRAAHAISCGAAKVKSYSYIAIGKYLGMSKFFRKGRPGAQGPLL